RFKNILVGVDLSQGERIVSAELPPPTAEAVERALWLAKMNSARVTFFYALDISPAAQRTIEASGKGEDSVVAEAKDVLNRLVTRAAADGIAAGMDVRFGKSWRQMIERVFQDGHDLVVAGTRHLGALKSFLVGSTGMKLLRKCPCPVWITQPQPESHIKSILVAHCLRTVGDIAMELGCSMAQLHGAELHVLHSLEFPELDTALPARISAEKAAESRLNAEQHIESQLSNYQFTHPPQVHIVTDPPDFAVLEEVQQHHIELAVMGTIARTGIRGLITGNTAEKLLPRIPCSVLAVKPPGFSSPVSI
ncbi:MAG: universal stress protein, partial [Pirellulaceae bacterium]